MKRSQPFPALLMVALALAFPRIVAGEQAGVQVRALLGDTELVVQGRVLKQQPAPGGLWYTFQVQKVLWAPPGVVQAILRIFAHGPGVCEGVELSVGDEFVIGATRLPPASQETLQTFHQKLWEGFEPEWPGEWPALAAPDGVVSLSGNPSLAEEVARLVHGVRDPNGSRTELRWLLLEMAGNDSPAIRQEAIRQLGQPSLELTDEDSAWILVRFWEEIEGPGNPRVLSAYLDLLKNRDVNELARQVGRKSPEAEVRVLKLFSIHGSPEFLPVFLKALESPSPVVRRAARAGLEVQNFRAVPSPKDSADRLGILLRAARDRASKSRSPSSRSSQR